VAPDSAFELFTAGFGSWWPPEFSWSQPNLLKSIGMDCRLDGMLSETGTALLREARSLSRRADKLSGTARTVDDPTTQQLTAQACTTTDQLVHHLMTLERHAQQGEKSAARRR